MRARRDVSFRAFRVCKRKINEQIPPIVFVIALAAGMGAERDCRKCIACIFGRNCVDFLSVLHDLGRASGLLCASYKSLTLRRNNREGSELLQSDMGISHTRRPYQITFDRSLRGAALRATADTDRQFI